jgi:hypothetical protein
VLLLGLVAGGPGVSATNARQDQRLVLAFYYAWYGTHNWTYDQVPDLPLSPYNSADRATIERHVREARGAGIDALVQAWYGPAKNQQTDSNFAVLLSAAQAQGLQASVSVNVNSPFMPDRASLVNGLTYLLTVHARHPAFLRYGGKPVIVFWRQQNLSVDAWVSIRAQVDPDRKTLWLAEGDDTTWLSVFDGLYLYSITWKENTNPLYTAAKMRQRVNAYNAEHGTQKVWVATTMPGYDDTHIAGRAGRFAYPRSPDYYRTTWQAAMASTPEMVMITSYNEWPEGTMIEPSVTYGDTFLKLTRELAAAYRAGATSVPATSGATSTITPKPTATRTVTPTPTRPATRLPTSSPRPVPTYTPTATVAPSATPSPTGTARASPAPANAPPPAGCPAALVVALLGGVGWLLRQRK